MTSNFDVLQFNDLKPGDTVLVPCVIKWVGNQGAYLRIQGLDYEAHNNIYCPVHILTKITLTCPNENDLK